MKYFACVSAALLLGGCGSKVDLGDTKQPAKAHGSEHDSGVSTSPEQPLDSGIMTSPNQSLDSGIVTSRTQPLDSGIVTSPQHPSECAIDTIDVDVKPTPTTATVEATCAGATAPTKKWGPPPSGATRDDRRASLVGRWVPCPGGRLLGVQYALEFGGNGRYRALETGDGGGLSESDFTGDFYLLGTGQLDLVHQGSTMIASLQFSADGQAFQGSDDSGAVFTYARTDASPLNGSDNPPPLSAGGCKLAGTWDASPADGSPYTFSFDGSGRFVAGTSDANLCGSPLAYGTYELDGGEFSVVTTYGPALC